MKNIILTTLIVLNTSISFAQTDGPSKKETFDFIVKILSNKVDAKSHRKPHIVDFDYDSSEIKLNNFNTLNLKNCDHLAKISMFLDDLTKIKTDKNKLMITLIFSKISATVEYTFYTPNNCKNYVSTFKRDKYNEIELLIKDSTSFERLYKAVNHWIKMHNVDDSLFDD